MDYQELQDKVRKLNGQPIFPGSDKGEWDPQTLYDVGIVKTVRRELWDNYEKVKKSSQDNWHKIIRNDLSEFFIPF